MNIIPKKTQVEEGYDPTKQEPGSEPCCGGEEHVEDGCEQEEKASECCGSAQEDPVLLSAPTPSESSGDQEAIGAEAVNTITLSDDIRLSMSLDSKKLLEQILEKLENIEVILTNIHRNIR